ncbi:hypothetical protein F6X40_11285 [Paraburkholderia sp. UCT31]|uniref:hypothetical protein n=1 Tax=Paraburkholderia sp. UCT31 TaxID=2615209 RepID=UPI001654DFD4|nr:hypothetical protein [Paraburkholderia sp. UCT31]MBC8737387.1 hypothetical protein [Paraburkholderia sp. UCT31]
MYEIKGYKTFKGHEGEPCGQGNLYRDGTKVAEWSDSSTGGSMHIRFVSREAEKLFAEHAKVLLATQKDFEGEPYKVDTMPIYELVETAMFAMSCEVAEKEAMRKDCKKGIVVRQTVDGKPEAVLYHLAYTAANVAALKAKHPSITEVVNETLGLPFVSAEKEAADKAAAEEKRYRKMCKTKTVFTIPGEDGKPMVMVCPASFNPRVALALRAKHPTLLEFFNERFAA